MQTEITQPGPLLDAQGRLAQVGWSSQPRLDCNLEAARFYTLRPLQFLRLKRWDYYAVFTPQRFFSVTIAHLGYAANLFVYTLDYQTNALHEEDLVIPLGLGVQLPRNSQDGEAVYSGRGVELRFYTLPARHQVYVSWPCFDHGRGLEATVEMPDALAIRAGDRILSVDGIVSNETIIRAEIKKRYYGGFLK